MTKRPVWWGSAVVLAAVVLLLARGGTARAGTGRWSPGIRDAFAIVQRNGRPYKTFYRYYITPHAVVEKGRVFCAYQDGGGRPIMMAYDTAAKRWQGPVRASHRGLGADTHGNPSICIDRNGRIHLFFGCHNRRMLHVRSARPYDIAAWQEAPSPTNRATYPESIRMADGRMFLFYRTGGHMEPWSVRTSDDDGETWSKAEKIVELRIAPRDRLAAAYCTFLPGAGHRTIHGFFVHKDDNPGRRRKHPHPWRPLKYPGLHEAVYRYNVYYIHRDAEGRWLGADGEVLGQLPLGKADADRHALVYDSGHEFASHKRIAIDEEDRPYLRFTVGVEDWKSKKIIVPTRTMYATVRDGRWRVTDRVTPDWPAAVGRQIMTPGPAAYDKVFPGPWFIHYQMGPREDPTATYIWLGHADHGYATRRGGPARSPKN